MAKGRKTGGRKKGTPNKLTRDVQEFVETIFQAVDPIAVTVDLMTRCKSEKVQEMVQLRLLEYRYGRPKQEVALHSSITLEDVLAARRRAGMEKPHVGLRSDETGERLQRLLSIPVPFRAMAANRSLLR